MREASGKRLSGYPACITRAAPAGPIYCRIVTASRLPEYEQANRNDGQQPEAGGADKAEDANRLAAASSIPDPEANRKADQRRSRSCDR
jgi:hypothetical protein